MPELELKRTSRPLQSAAVQYGSKTYSNIYISGNARVHLGDAYYDHLTIKQLCQVREVNDAIIHQTGSLRGLSQTSGYPIGAEMDGDETIQQRVDQINDSIQLRNSQLQQALYSPARSTTSTRLVSRTRLNFTLIPLGFSFERDVYHEEDQIRLPKKNSKTRAQRTQTLFSLRVPAWFAGYQYTVCVNRATSGWRFHLRVLIDVPRQTYFMTACKFGWMDRIKRHLSSNPSVLNERYNGLTAMDMALFEVDLDTISFLAGQGIRPSIGLEDIFTNEAYISRFQMDHALFDVQLYASDLERYVNQANRIIERMATSYGLAMDELWDIACSWSASDGRIERYRTLLKYPHWSQYEAVKSVLLVGWPNTLGGNDRHFRTIESLVANFGRRLPPQALKCEDRWENFSVNILHWILMTVGDGFKWNASVGSIWSRLIEDTISAGVDIHFADSRADRVILTPLFAFFIAVVPSISVFEQTKRRSIDIPLQSLAKLLLDSGVDLVSFGKVESCPMTRNATSLWKHDSTYFHAVANWIEDVLGLAYGPQPSDWHVKYLSVFPDHGEEFWRMVEGPLSLYDLLRETSILQTQQRRPDNPSTPALPGRWMEEPHGQQIEICYVFDFLTALNLEDYHDLESHVHGFDADHFDSDDNSESWWYSGELVRCGKL